MIPEPAYFWDAGGTSRHSFHVGCLCPVIAGWVVCDGLWDGCWQHRSCWLGAWCCACHPWEICALADWTLGDLEPFDVHSLGEALRGYLQDLPSPVVPVSVHGDILRVLQGKGLPWPRLGMGGWAGRTRLGY